MDGKYTGRTGLAWKAILLAVVGLGVYFWFPWESKSDCNETLGIDFVCTMLPYTK